MDFKNRKNFNIPQLIITTAFGLLVIVTGFIVEARQDLRTAMEFLAHNVEGAGTATQHIDANAVRISGTASQAAEAAGDLLGLASGVSDQGHTVQCRVLEFPELVRTA